MSINWFISRVLIGAALAAPSIFASTVTTFQSTSSFDSNAVNVKAVFTATGNGLMSVTLFNLSNIDKDTQVLTGVYFTYAGESTVNSAVGQTGNPTFNISSSNNLTATGSNSSKWNATTATVSGVGYDVLTNLNPTNGGCGGCEGILGSGTGSSTNTSLANHNPYLVSDSDGVTFTVSGLSGLTANTAITGAYFNFGTALGQKGALANTAVLTATPEPGTISLALGGAALLLFARRRKSA